MPDFTREAQAQQLWDTTRDIVQCPLYVGIVAHSDSNLQGQQRFLRGRSSAWDGQDDTMRGRVDELTLPASRIRVATLIMGTRDRSVFFAMNGSVTRRAAVQTFNTFVPHTHGDGRIRGADDVDPIPRARRPFL